MTTKAPAIKSRTWYTREGAIINYSGNEKEIVVPNEINGQPITVIGSYAFSPAKKKLKDEVRLARESIESVSFSEGIIGIQDSVFEGCKALTTVNLPESLRYVAEKAFYECESLQAIDLGSRPLKVDRQAFAFCSSLKSAVFPERLDDYGTVPFKCFERCTSLEHVVMPKIMTYIPMMMFYDCRSLKSITLPSTVREIQTDSFHGCSSLRSITIPATVKIINTWAFYGCSSLEEITFEPGSKLETIAHDAFRYCSIKRITFPKALEPIVNQIFGKNPEIEKVVEDQ